jgi:hypothetical protein
VAVLKDEKIKSKKENEEESKIEKELFLKKKSAWEVLEKEKHASEKKFVIKKSKK